MAALHNRAMPGAYLLQTYLSKIISRNSNAADFPLEETMRLKSLPVACLVMCLGSALCGFADGPNPDPAQQPRQKQPPDLMPIKPPTQEDEDFKQLFRLLFGPWYLDKAAKETLTGAKEIELLSLDPSEKKTEQDKDTFHGWKVLGSTKITDEATRKKLTREIETAIDGTRQNDKKQCFIPRHGLRAKAGDRTVEFLICFQCGRVVVYGEKEAIQSPGIRKAPEPFFDELLKKAGVPLAPKAEEK
jgi:hypothetical protein